MIFRFHITALLLASSLLVFGGANAAGKDIIYPSSVSSSKDDGSLTVSLSLEVAEMTTSEFTITTRAYNGTVPGPTIRLKAGDEFTLNFLNNLPGAGTEYKHNRISDPDATNIHYHGLHVDGDLPSDDSTLTIAAGESFTYMSSLPATHMPGTHWYHPHRHGSTALQVGGGAAGALIVDDVAGTLPIQVETAQEVIMVVQEFLFEELEEYEEDTEGAVFKVSSSDADNYITVNGQVKPVIGTDPGRWMRLRIINAGGDEDGTLEINIPDCEMQLLAKDGVYIRDFPRSIMTAFVPMGGRADIMVRCMGTSTSYDIENNFEEAVQSVLATIKTSENEEESLDSSDLQTWDVNYPPYLEDLTNTDPSPGCSCTTHLDRDAVNGKKFDPDVTLHEAYLGAVVERKIIGFDHPYHQHVYPFQIIERDNNNNNNDRGGGRDSSASSSPSATYFKPGDWHDTLDGSSTVRYQPKEFVTKIMLHCHVLEHEDEGMMAIDQVREASYGKCSCTRDGGALPTLWIIVLSVLGVIVLYLIAARFMKWYPCRRKTTTTTSEAENNDDPEQAPEETEPKQDNKEGNDE